MKKLFGASVLALLLSAPAAQAAMEIEVLSNRADLISAGDALVEIQLPAGTDPSSVVVRDDGRDVSSAFGVNADGRFLGVVEGLDVGDNVLTATVPDGSGARITIVNHPNGGPVFSGPQVQPWACQETAVDEQCNEPVTYEFQYKNASGQFGAYDPENPPSRRRDDDDRPGQRGAVHRPHRDGLPGARPVQDRGPLRPVQAVHRGEPRRTASTTSS